MKVTLTIRQSNGTTIHQIQVDDVHIKNIHDLAQYPEDAVIGKCLVDGQQIIQYIQMGFDAAMRGETLEFEVQE